MLRNAFANVIPFDAFLADSENYFGFYYFMRKNGRKRLA